MIRIGFGYDSHRFEADRPLVLGGVRIADGPGLAGHSDADAVLHALIDALLGAAGAGDIGEQFPDTDAEWAGADSSELLRKVLLLPELAKWQVVNCDFTVLAEKPKLGAAKGEIAANIARLLRIDASAVAVKAKTNEGMGAIGRGEGIAVMVAILVKDDRC